MSKIDLTKYGITGATEVVYNPDYDTLYNDELNFACGLFKAVEIDATAACTAKLAEIATKSEA